MRFAGVLVVVLALGASVQAQKASFSNKDVENVLMQFIQDLSESFDGAASTKRRLLTLGGEGSLHSFLSGMLGEGWQSLVPENWSLPSFDWSSLGEFEYSSNLGDFLMNHDLRNLTDIRSAADLHESLAAVEAAFCTPESFKPTAKVPASCSGPTVTISLQPKVCVLQAATKQVVCEPAKLVLTKTPGSCTHKYISAAEWKGKECKIEKIAGLAKNATVGGGNKLVPLPEVDFHHAHAPSPAPARK